MSDTWSAVFQHLLFFVNLLKNYMHAVVDISGIHVSLSPNKINGPSILDKWFNGKVPQGALCKD